MNARTDQHHDRYVDGSGRGNGQVRCAAGSRSSITSPDRRQCRQYPRREKCGPKTAARWLGRSSTPGCADGAMPTRSRARSVKPAPAWTCCRCRALTTIKTDIAARPGPGRLMPHEGDGAALRRHYEQLNRAACWPAWRCGCRSQDDPPPGRRGCGVRNGAGSGRFRSLVEDAAARQPDQRRYRTTSLVTCRRASLAYRSRSRPAVPPTCCLAHDYPGCRTARP